MKKYPVDVINEVDMDTMNPTGMTFEVPTEEAFAKFTEYLDPDELEFHSKLGMPEKLQLAFSCNPFNALLDMMGKKRA